MKEYFSSRGRLAGVFFFLFAYAISPGLVQASPFAKVISFGDSLSDTGNIFAASGGVFPPPGIYTDGRFSDGPVWAEHLADDLRVDLYDYAYGGAKTDETNYNEGRIPAFIPLIGLVQQVDNYLEETGEDGAGKRDLFLLAIGANDFFDFFSGGEDPMVYGIQNTITQLTRLLDAGAMHVVVLNIPDLGATPEFVLNRTPEEQAGATGLVSLYNACLESALAGLDAAYPGRIVVVDTFAIINDIIADPGKYGLTNADIPVLYGGDPGGSLFFDGVHPTTLGHRIMADYALEAMADAYIPGRMLGLDGAFPALSNP